MAVDVTSGAVSLTFTDISITGKFPLVWKRRYSTSLLDSTPSPLGPGWTSPYFAKLTRMGKDFHFYDSNGSLVVFPDPKDELESGKILRNLGSYCEIAKSGFNLRVTQWDANSHDVVRFVFQAARNGQLWPLKSLEDVTGQGLDFAWDDMGLLKGIRQKLEKRTLVVSHTSDGKLSSVAFRYSDGRQQLLVKYQYDGYGRLTAATNALEQTDHFEYRNDGRIVREIVKDGAVFNFKYDDLGRCVRAWGLDNYDLKVFRYFNHTSWSEVVNSYGHVTRYHQTPSGQLESKINPLGGISKTEYDEFGRTLKIIDALGAETCFAYDEFGNRKKTIDPLGNESTYLFNANHQAIEFKDAKGNEWKKDLDEKGRLKAVHDPGGGIWEYAYDEDGNPIEIRNPLGPKSQLKFQSNGDLAEIKDWDGLVSKYQCDEFGRIVRFETPTGKITLRSFDLLGRLVTIEESPKEKYVFQYNAKGKLVHSVNSKGKIFKRVYGPCGRLIERVDSNGKKYKYVWGSEPSMLMRFINPQGETYDFGYDAAGKKIRERAFDGKETFFKRDLVGNCIATGNDPNKSVVLVSDKKGQLVSKIFPNGSVTAFTYDAMGMMESAENPDCKLEFQRDTMGRVVQENQGDRTLYYEYDISGNLLKVAADKDFEVSYSYGESGTLNEIVHNGTHKIKFLRDRPSNIVYRVLPGSVALSHQNIPETYALIQKLDIDGKPALQKEFKFSEDGKLTSISDSRYGLTKYSYNQIGRVVGSHFQNGETDSFEYDSDGHLVLMGLTGKDPIPLEYSHGDRLRRRGEKSYSYDEAGRIESIAQENGPNSELKWTLTWDAMDQLRQVTKTDGETWTYSYDPLGRRISKKGPQGETKFLWDRNAVIQNTSNDFSSSWVYGPSGLIPLGKETNGNFYSIIPDHLGTPMELVDGKGEIAWSASYHLFGETKRQESNGPDCEVRFPGQWHDSETGFHYNRFRYYNPSTGNYISQDPIGLRGGINPYAYGGNPLNWIDPYGLVMLYRGMKTDANGDPVVYSGETKNGNNAADSLGVRPNENGMSTNTDTDAIQDHRKPEAFGGNPDKPSKPTAMFAIDSEVLAEHGLVADPDHDSHVSIKVADGEDPKTLPEKLAATKDLWKPVTPEEVAAQKEADAKKGGGCGD